MSAPKGDYRSASLREHFVYRAYDDLGVLLYVGCTRSPKRRLSQHRTNRAAWLSRMHSVKMTGPMDYEAARRLELREIAEGSPVYNASSSVRVGSDLPEVRLVALGSLTQQMQAMGLSIRALAEMVGCSHATIGHLRSGRNERIRPQWAAAIEEHLRVPGQLFERAAA